MDQLSKNQIKERLIKRASKHWKYTGNELENDFDPIVGLLFDVCAKELEKISHEIFSSRRRITERLVEILTPTSSSKAIPTRGIIQAMPSEENIVLNDYHQFCYKKEIGNTNNPINKEFKNYYFGPTKSLKLTQNSLKYVVLPNGISEVVDAQLVQKVSFKKHKQSIPHSTVYFGVTFKRKEIKNLMFYFYLNNITYLDTFYFFLPKAIWSINGQNINVRKGYNVEVDNKNLYSTLVNEDFSYLNEIEQHVNNYYEKNFITLEDIPEIDQFKNNLPEELKEILDAGFYSQLEGEDIVWIKVKFPDIINNQILSNIYCATNCFPAINKQLHETQGNINNLLNIYPLNVNDNFFLQLHSVLDDKNIPFEISSNSTHENNFAYLRYGGITRFDERNVTELIQYLIDMVRDESAAFSKLGTDFTELNLKEINQIISRFRSKIEDSEILQRKNPYLILNAKKTKQSRTLFAKYWTTNGVGANKIKAFSKLTLQRGIDFKKGSIRLVSSAQGGKDEPSSSDKIYAYRESLISSQKVVSRQDIIILCQKHYQNAIKNITIKNGIQTNLDNNIGYTPTIDIYIDKNLDIKYTSSEWSFLKEDLLLTLEERSINVVPFRIIYN